MKSFYAKVGMRISKRKLAKLIDANALHLTDSFFMMSRFPLKSERKIAKHVYFFTFLIRCCSCNLEVTNPIFPSIIPTSENCALKKNVGQNWNVRGDSNSNSCLFYHF